MSAAPPPFDAVLFDLDGTLVATERFWVRAARAGARKALAELGLERELPSAEAWMGMVGLPLPLAFQAVFPELDAAQRAHLLARCVEEEEAALRAGEAALMPGAREALEELRARGARIGIASNCGGGYLGSMLDGLALRERIDAARCLDSRGVRAKADMVRDLLATFGTRSAVMVGDRRGDAEAAHQNGIPHVHLASGFAPVDEAVEAEAVLGDLGELVARLDRRNAWILEALERVRGGRELRSLGISGPPASGKSLFARDLARLVRAGGRAAVAVDLERFRLPSAPLGVAALEHLDLGALVDGLLEPHLAGAPAIAGAAGPVPPEALLVVEGAWVLHPQVRAHLERTLHLELPEPASLARIVARAEPALADDALVAARRGRWPAWRRLEQSQPPAIHADLVLQAANPLGPP